MVKKNVSAKIPLRASELQQAPVIVNRIVFDK
jgi:hypothetical protein